MKKLLPKDLVMSIKNCFYVALKKHKLVLLENIKLFLLENSHIYKCPFVNMAIPFTVRPVPLLIKSYNVRVPVHLTRREAQHKMVFHLCPHSF